MHHLIGFFSISQNNYFYVVNDNRLLSGHSQDMLRDLIGGVNLLKYKNIMIGCFQIRLRFTRLWYADYNLND
jgi:hypothetical protein